MHTTRLEAQGDQPHCSDGMSLPAGRMSLNLRVGRLPAWSPVLREHPPRLQEGRFEVHATACHQGTAQPRPWSHTLLTRSGTPGSGLCMRCFLRRPLNTLRSCSPVYPSMVTPPRTLASSLLHSCSSAVPACAAYQEAPRPSPLLQTTSAHDLCHTPRHSQPRSTQGRSCLKTGQPPEHIPSLPIPLHHQGLCPAPASGQHCPQAFHPPFHWLTRGTCRPSLATRHLSPTTQALIYSCPDIPPSASLVLHPSQQECLLKAHASQSCGRPSGAPGH